MKNILTGILICLSVIANAQNYLVTLKNDTLRGDIKILTYDNLVDRVDVIDAQKKKEHFKCIQVKAVVQDGKIYKPVRTAERGYRFMQLQQEGYLSYFMSRRQASSIYEVPTLVKRNGDAVEIPGMSFKRVMKNFLSECPDIVEKFSKDVYSRSDVSKIVTDYNTCLDAQTIVVNTPKTSIVDKDKLGPVNALKEKIEASSIEVKSKASDILADIADKLKSGKTIPNYLIDGLKDTLSSAPEFKDDLDKVVAALKEQ